MTLAACTPEIRNAFYTDKSLAAITARATVIPKRARAKDGHWKVWENFIATFENVDAYLDGESQSVKLSFSKFLPRDSERGSLHPAGKLLEVDQWRSTYGPSERRLHWTTTCLDPRYTNTEKLHPAIGKLQRSYAKEDPPSTTSETNTTPTRAARSCCIPLLQ
jgi:hypothetical protein